MVPCRLSARYVLAALAALLLVAGPEPALAQKKKGTTTFPYRLTDLGGFTGGSIVQSNALALNEPDADGMLRIAGTSYVQSIDWRHPALWQVDAVTGTTLSLVDLAPSAPPGHAQANAVNDAGLVVGTLGADWAFADIPGTGLEVLTTDSPGNTFGRGCNNRGEIVGSYGDWGVLWRIAADGTLTGPIDLPWFSPQAINDDGVMAGQFFDLDTEIHKAAIAWFEGDQLEVVPLPGLFAEDRGGANAINNLGEVVGYSLGNGAKHPFLWTPQSGTIALETVDGRIGEALGINDLGQIVGWSDTRSGQRAVLWQNGSVVALNSLIGTGSKATLARAEAINNAGHIAGTLLLPKPVNESHGFLLTPNP